jgi:dTDP-glucose 4,6-dehydratase
VPSSILITGGAGFIGSHLCEHFLAKGDDVVALDNFMTGSRDNVAHLMDDPSFLLVEHDITTPYFPDSKPDLVMHFASPASPPQYLANPIHTLKVGSYGAIHSLGIAKAAGARFVMASTSEIYGDPAVSPQPETYWGNVSTIGPRGVYDEAKRFSEAATMSYHRAHGVDTRLVRIFNTYGPRLSPGDGRAIPNFMSQALAGEPITIYGDGSQTRSFCYIDDLVAGIVALIDKGGPDPVNLGNPDERTIRELAELVISLVGSDSKIEYLPLPQDDPKVRCPDISRARELLDWSPKVELEDGLGRTLEWFRSDQI